MTIREVVRQAVADAGLTANALAVRLVGRVGRSQVFDFLNGSHDLTSEKLDHVLAELKLVLTYDKDR